LGAYQWQEWLKTNGFTEGVRQLPDGRKLILTSGSAVVRAKPGSARWVAARNLAVDQAELDAKKNLAEFIDMEIKGNRLVQLATQGGETPPPMMAEAVEELSIAQKARVLTSSALDDQIRRFNPKWDGTGRSDEQKRAVLITLQEKIRDHVSARARLLTSGAYRQRDRNVRDAPNYQFR